jgi:antitoxin component YwqK of YwqJK toxin-antitoxin module
MVYRIVRENNMRNQLYLFLFALSFFSCTQQHSKVDFFGYTEQDSIYWYQEGNCAFVVNGLIEQLQAEHVNSALYTVTTSKFPDYPSETLLNKDNFYISDSMEFYLKSETLVPDDSVEIVGQPTDIISFYGELEVYYSNGDTLLLNDTIDLFRANPLFDEKMVGELVDGKRQGYWKEYNDEAHNLLSRSSFFEDGLRHGQDTIFIEGKKHIISNWSHGKKNGYFITYYKNGIKNNEILFKSGQPIDPLITFTNKGDVLDSAYLFSDNPTTNYLTSSKSE